MFTLASTQDVLAFAGVYVIFENFHGLELMIFQRGYVCLLVCFVEYPGGELILWKLQSTADGQSAWKMHKSLLYGHCNTTYLITFFYEK